MEPIEMLQELSRLFSIDPVQNSFAALPSCVPGGTRGWPDRRNKIKSFQHGGESKNEGEVDEQLVQETGWQVM